MKEIVFVGGSLDDVKKFPEQARERAVMLLEMLQNNIHLQPKDFKYIPAVGVGVYELRIRIKNQYRVFYVAKSKKAIYVLHAFMKKTQTTAKKEISKGMVRYKLVSKELTGNK
jgi:phage-related protein